MSRNQSDIPSQMGDLPEDEPRRVRETVGYNGPGYSGGGATVGNGSPGGGGIVGRESPNIRRLKKVASDRDIKQFINRTAMTNRVYAITDQANRIMAANIYRRYLIMVNTGSQTVFVSFTNNAGVSGSIPILSTGNYEPWIIPYSEVFALCSVGNTSTLVVGEGFYENL